MSSVGLCIVAVEFSWFSGVLSSEAVAQQLTLRLDVFQELQLGAPAFPHSHGLRHFLECGLRRTYFLNS